MVIDQDSDVKEIYHISQSRYNVGDNINLYKNVRKHMLLIMLLTYIEKKK